MIKIDLVKELLLDAQLDQASKTTGKDKGDLRAVCYGAKAILEKDCKKGRKFDIVPGMTEKEGEVSGAEAVSWLCKEHGLQITPVKTIEIPVDVYYECTDRQWQSISYYAATAAKKNEQIREYMAIGAPDIIISNETRMLMGHVDALECGSRLKPMRWKDGTIMRSLNDIGYSIISGWSDWMREEFAKRDEDLCRQMDEMEFEEVEDGGEGTEVA